MNSIIGAARRQFERTLYLNALQATNWNIPRAAERLGIQRTNLYRKMRVLGISKSRDQHPEGVVVEDQFIVTAFFGLGRGVTVAGGPRELYEAVVAALGRSPASQVCIRRTLAIAEPPGPVDE